MSNHINTCIRTNSNPQSGYSSTARFVSQQQQSSFIPTVTGAMSFDQTPFKAMVITMPQQPLSSQQSQQSRTLAQSTVPLSATVTPNNLKSNSVRSLQQQASLAAASTQLSSKDNAFHKKLDRSFSEPAERKCLSALAQQQQQQQQNGSVSARYKTELCRSFVESGSCKYGEKCQFAHGNDELRAITRHPKFKTENCRRFHSIGFCPYGPRCHFIHNGEEEQRKFSLQYAAGNTSPSNGSPSVVNGALPNSTSASLSISVNNAFATNSAAVVNQSSSSFFFDSSSPTSPNAAFRPVSNFNSVESHDPLVRPKALSFGSTSLGSSGEISTASSSSQSPTSLGSFFNEFDSMFNVPSMQSAFSVSSDSFGKFPSWTPVFGGSQRSLKPDEANSDIPDSLLFNLVGAKTQQDFFTDKSFFDHYPSVSVSPSVDSVNSELEALKISPSTGTSAGAASNHSDSSGYSPVSAFSPSEGSPSSTNSTSAFNRFDCFFTAPSTASKQNGRLPTFAKFSTNSQQ